MNMRDEGWSQGRDFIWKAADWEDGRLPQNKQYWGLDARFFYRSEGKKQWRTKVKRKSREGNALGKQSKRAFSLAKNISKGMDSFWKGCVNLFYAQVGREKLSLLELNKSTLVYSQAEVQVPPGNPLSMIIIIKASQRNSFQHGVRIDFLPETYLNCPTVCVTKVF